MHFMESFILESFVNMSVTSIYRLIIFMIYFDNIIKIKEKCDFLIDENL